MMSQTAVVVLLALTLTTVVTGRTNTTGRASVCSTQRLYATVGGLGYLASPGYPLNYSNNLQCGWLIAAGGWDSTNVVKVTILSASMEPRYDYVQLYDGSSSYGSRSLVKFYSMPNQTVYYSSGQYMYIKFTTDGSVTSLGFRLTYEAVNRQNVSTPSPPLTTTTDVATVCSSSGVYTDVRYGQPQVLNFARNIYSSLDCQWIIRSADTNDYFTPYVIHMTVEEFIFSSCSWSGCSCGYLQVFDGDSTSATSLGRVCASSYTTTDFYSSGRYATVLFYANSYSYSSASFRLHYESVPQADVSTTSPPLTTTTDVATVCSSSGVYTDVRYGQPQVLNFARNIYSSLDCQWIIRSADTNDYFTPYVIHMTVEDFILSSCSWSGCSCGYLQVFDGDSTSATSLGRVCASSYTTTDFYSSGRYATVLFYGNGYTYSSASFRLHYESVPQTDVSTTPTFLTTSTYVSSGCSVYTDTINAAVGQVGYLTSPSYPQNYDSNANCRWLVDAGSSDYVVRLTILDAIMEQCDPCCDYLRVFDGESDSSSSLITLCSMGGQTVFYSSGRYMYINFYSDSAVTNTGFRLSYEAVYEHSVPTLGQSAPTGHVAAAVVGGVLGTAFLTVLIILIYVVRCRRQRLRPTNTYLYNETTSSSNNNLLYTTTAPPTYNSVYVVGAPPPYPGIATPYPFAGFTNRTFAPTETAEEGAVTNPSSVARQDEDPKLQAPTEADPPPLYAAVVEFTNTDTTSLVF